MDTDDNLSNLRAATLKLQQFTDKLGSYRDAAVGLTSEHAASLIVDQQAAADTCVAAFQDSVRRPYQGQLWRRREMKLPPPRR